MSGTYYGKRKEIEYVVPIFCSKNDFLRLGNDTYCGCFISLCFASLHVSIGLDEASGSGRWSHQRFCSLADHWPGAMLLHLTHTYVGYIINREILPPKRKRKRIITLDYLAHLEAIEFLKLCELRKWVSEGPDDMRAVSTRLRTQLDFRGVMRIIFVFFNLGTNHRIP